MKNIFRVLLLLCGASFITSCGSDSGFSVEPIPTAFVVVINAIPDSPALTSTSNNIPLGTISYGTSTGIVGVLPEIQLSFQVQYIDNGTVRTLIEQDMFIELDHTQVMVLTGTMAAPRVVTIDQLPPEFAAGSTDTNITFINVTSDLASANIQITNPNGGDQLVTVNQDIVTAVVTTTAGDNVEARVSTTGGETLWQSGTFRLTPRTSRLFVLIDYFGPTSEMRSSNVRLFSLLEQADAGLFINEDLPASIRFANMASQAGPVDLNVDVTVTVTETDTDPDTDTDDIVTTNTTTNSLVSDLSFPGLIDDINIDLSPVNSGIVDNVTTRVSFDFSVVLNSDTANELASTTDTILLPGTFYTLGVSVLDDVNGFALIDEDRRRVPARARLSILNLSASADSINIFLMDPGVAADISGRLVSAFPHLASVSNDIRSGTFDFIVTSSTDDEILVGPTTISIDTNNIYTIIIRDNDGGGAPIQIELLDDFNT